jgi:hypothetical protein
MRNALPITSSTSALSDRGGVTDAVRARILATEHWSLLAIRSMTWNEMFNRASLFITVLSAAVVALALVAQATAFGSSLLHLCPADVADRAPGGVSDAHPPERRQ